MPAKPLKKARDARFKLRVVRYSKEYGVRRAADKYGVSAGSISGKRGWESREENLKKMVHRSGGHRKTLHPGKRSQYHQVEGVLRRWLFQRRKRRVLVTKRMLIRKAKELSLKLRELTPKQLEDWWSGFRRRRHTSLGGPLS